MTKIKSAILLGSMLIVPTVLQAAELSITSGYYAPKGECSNMYAQSLDGEVKFLIDDTLFMGGSSISGYDYSCKINALIDNEGEKYGVDELEEQELNSLKSYKINATCDEAGNKISLDKMSGRWFYWFTSNSTYTRGRVEQASAFKNGWYVYTEEYELCYAAEN